MLQCLEARLKRKCSPWMFSLKEWINFFPVRNIPRSTMIEGSRLKGDRAWLTYMQFTRCNSRRDKEWLVDYWCVTLLEYYLYENGPCENTMRKIALVIAFALIVHAFGWTTLNSFPESDLPYKHDWEIVKRENNCKNSVQLKCLLIWWETNLFNMIYWLRR